MLSSWEHPIEGPDLIQERIDAGVAYLHQIHHAVLKAGETQKEDLMELCRQVVSDLGLPPFAVNPLVARSFASSLAAGHADPRTGPSGSE